MERRLGKGLGALLSEPVTNQQDASESPRSELEIGLIQPNPFQPRRTFEPASLAELRNSIQNHGVLQPIVVRPKGSEFELISGERRWRAARLAGLTAIPAVVREDVSDDEMLELALVENVQRRDLDPMERARGFAQLMNQLGLTQEAVANRVGLRRATIANHLRLLELPQTVQDLVGRGRLSMGHARALLSLPDEPAQLQMAGLVLDDDLSVRAIERLVREAVGGSSEPDRPAQSDVHSDEERVSADNGRESAEEKGSAAAPWIGELESRMEKHLGTKVRLASSPEYRGRVVIEFYERDGLERLLTILAPQEEL